MNTLPKARVIPNSTKSSSEVAGGKFNPANVFFPFGFPLRFKRTRIRTETVLAYLVTVDLKKSLEPKSFRKTLDRLDRDPGFGR